MDDMEMTAKISGLEKMNEVTEKRLDKIDSLSGTIHTLATNVAVMAKEISTQNKMFETIISKYDDKLKNQGERIGILEQQPSLGVKVEALEQRIYDLEHKPAKKWEALANKLMLFSVGAILTYFAARFGLIAA